jgi:DNA-binding response OmpR family regulator
MAAVVLVVEDEPDIRDLLVLHLEHAGYRCHIAASGPQAIESVRRLTPDLVVLDVMLPGMDGLEVCRRLRADPHSAAIPVVMLTARTDEVDRVVGLEMGADDYVTKPFSPRELVARVRAVLRRTRSNAHEERSSSTTIGALVVDRDRHEVRLDGTRLSLTRTEFELLDALLEARGRLLTREQLLNRVWGYARADEIVSRTVDVHVHRLRAKLRREGERLVTVKGVGYRFEAES